MEEFDIIIVGGGSGGCAAAARLAERGKYSICLIEAGGNNDSFWVKTPGMMPFIPDVSNYRYDTVPQKGLGGRVGYQPRGRGLGGSSAINAMVYIRGNAWDYDNWAAMGCDGWSFEDVLPVFKRNEGNERGGDAYHGAAGPLNVMDQHYANPGSAKFVEAASRLQLPITDDFNGASQEGFGMYQVTQKGGERWSASRAFLEPLIASGRVSAVTGAVTEKVITENGRATAVQIRQKGSTRTIKARGAIILAAGAFGSPQILQLSGIGPAQHLREKSIHVVLDKGEVGSNLHDHIDYVAAFETTSKEFLGRTLTGNWRSLVATIQHIRKRTGPMTTPYAESGGFWRSSPDLRTPDIQFHFVPAPLEDHGRTKVTPHGFSCHACVLRPFSRGSVRLNSTDAVAVPAIDPGFLTDDRDMETLKAGVRMMYRIFDAPPLGDFERKDRHAVDLNDDAALEAMIRSRADTVYHPVGTCRMGADKDAVVDPRLQFRGIDGLYIGDASIMPQIVSGNTNAPSIMIGDRCADFVHQDLR